ncbi:DUF1007 family protein [Limisalsivibrio acetivorans]|uniref:DUF1007 family protein n=1 Tax=Limisalsivibrio acetivorans TaxID=1304888 RepID=UPI0003B6DBAA|nr:DUF1007 family protein [Limisalsivibrio acetivorans]
MNTKTLQKLALIIVIIMHTALASAHPHVFMDSEVSFVFNEQGVEKLLVHWEFDEMFSSGIIMDYDDGDRVIDEEERKLIRRDVFENLVHHGYFLRIDINGESFPVEFVDMFDVSIKGNRLVYDFSVPLGIPAKGSGSSIDLKVLDSTNYTAIVSLKAKKPTLHSSGFSTTIEYAEPDTWSRNMNPESIGSLRLVFSKK